MKNERRSMYRVLHVQPEAPTEIITAAYRCLMTKLRHHPDLGGDHDTAVQINEAYAVLSNPARRRAYDQSRRQKRAAPGMAAPHTSQSHSQARPNGTPERGCPFCGHAIPRVIAMDTRCNQCDSPLAPIAHSIGNQREAAGRRGAARVDKNEAAMIYPAHGRRPSTARLRDLSPSGISLYTGAAVAIGSQRAHHRSQRRHGGARGAGARTRSHPAGACLPADGALHRTAGRVRLGLRLSPLQALRLNSGRSGCWRARRASKAMQMLRRKPRPGPVTRQPSAPQLQQAVALRIPPAAGRCLSGWA